MEKIKIIMDVDTGIDDAIAMCLALGNEKFDVLGFTTVYGNRDIEKTTENTLAMLELLNKTYIPVAKGIKKPLINEFNPPEKSFVHGADGLGDIKNPLPKAKIKAVELSAVEFMAKVLREEKEPITLVPVGPMTNIAAFLLAHPELKCKIKEIVIMGGSSLKGNTSFVAEANIHKDPEAAYILFNSGVQIKMAGLDATMESYLAFDEMDGFREENWLASILCEMCAVYEEHYRYVMKAKGLAMHDSLPLAWLIAPELVYSEDCYVTADIDGRHTYGLTAVDRKNVLNKKPNVTVAFNMTDRKRFVEMIKDAVQKLADEKQH